MSFTDNKRSYRIERVNSQVRTKDQRFYLVYYQRFTAIDFVFYKKILSLACISVLRW